MFRRAECTIKVCLDNSFEADQTVIFLVFALGILTLHSLYGSPSDCASPQESFGLREKTFFRQRKNKITYFDTI